MAKKKTYEENLKELDEIIEKLEEGDLSLDDSIKEYEKSMKLLVECGKILDEAQSKIQKITVKNGKLELEDIE